MSTKQPLSKTLLAVVFISGSYLFFVTLALAPFLNFTIFSSFHTVTKLLLAASAGIIGLIQLTFALPFIKRGSLRIKGHLITYGSIVSLVGLFFSTLFSSSPLSSLFGMYTAWESNVMVFLVFAVLLLSWITYFLVLRAFNLEKLVFHMLLDLLLFMAIIYGLGEYYFWKPSSGYLSQSVSRISLGFRNPLFAAYLLGMLWNYSSVRVGEVLESTKKGLGQIATVILHLILYGGISTVLILTFTRSAFLAAAGTALLLGIIQLTRSLRGNSNIVRTLIVLLLLLIIPTTIGYAYRKELSLRNTDLTTEAQSTLSIIAYSIGDTSEASALSFYTKASQYSSMQIRLLEWKWGVRTWTGSLKNFLLGIGPDAGFYEMPKYRDSVFNNFPTDSATKPYYVRNLYINSLMQFGLITVVGFLLLALGVVKKLFGSAKKELPAVAIVLAFFAQGLFYYSSLIPTILMLFAISYLISRNTDEEETLVRRTNPTEKALLVLTALLILCWIFPIAKASYIISSYSQSALPAPVEQMAQNAGLPLNNNVLVRYLVYHYPESTQALKYLPVLSNSKDVDDLRIASDAHYMISRNSGNRKDVLNSIATLESLVAIDPTLPATWDSLGLRHLYMGNFPKARESFMKALELKPDYWYSYMHLGEVSRQECLPKEALDWYKKAEEFIPTAENEIMEANQEIKTPRQECK